MVVTRGRVILQVGTEGRMVICKIRIRRLEPSRMVAMSDQKAEHRWKDGCVQNPTSDTNCQSLLFCGSLTLTYVFTNEGTTVDKNLLLYI